MVCFLLMLDQQEIITKFRVQRFGPVSHHGQATAFFRPIFAKSSNDHMPARANCTHDLFDISMAVSRIIQEMDHGTVMPDVEPAYGQLCTSNVAFHPVHNIRMFPQTLLCDSKRRR